MTMLKLTAKLIPIRAIKLLLKFLASLASAIVVVSGYLFFVSNIDSNRDADVTLNSSGSEEADGRDDPEED